MSEESAARQRDRFITFAFAASDVLIEVDPSDRICFIAGSVGSLFGVDPALPYGAEMVSFIAPEDLNRFQEFTEKLKRSGRASDLKVGAVKPGETQARCKIQISGMMAPDKSGIQHLCIKKLMGAAKVVAPVKASPMSIMDFSVNASSLVDDGADRESRPELALFDFNWSAVERKLGKREADRLAKNLIATMDGWAAHGTGVGKVGEGRFSMLLDKGTGTDPIKERLTETARKSHPKLSLDVGAATVSLDDLIDGDGFGELLSEAMEAFQQSGGKSIDLDKARKTLATTGTGRRHYQ